jgi:hypothetical protein
MKDADIHFAHAKTIVLVHRRLGLQWLKLAEKARVAGGRTRHVTSSLRDAAAHTAARSAISEKLPKPVVGKHLIARATT